MQKKEELIQNFKTAIASTTKSVSNVKDIEVIFGNEKLKTNKKIIKLPDLQNINEKIDYTKARALADSEALKIRYSNEKILKSYEPEGNISKKLYNADIEGLCCVDVVKGCAMLINSNLFNEVGKFDENYFLFYEEIDLCKKIKKKNYSIVLCNESLANHKTSSSSKDDYITLFIKSYHIEKSTMIYYRKNKLSFAQIWKLIKYIFRTFTYLLILNIKKSLINFAKFFAIINYMLK